MPYRFEKFASSLSDEWKRQRLPTAMLKVFGQIDEHAEPAGAPVGVYSGYIRAIQLNTFKRPIR